MKVVAGFAIISFSAVLLLGIFRPRTVNQPTLCTGSAPCVLTSHNDLARDGVTGHETLLSPASIAAQGFGRLASLPVDGFVYAQPLFVTGVSLGSGDIVYVATENDSVYAFDANTYAKLWGGPIIPSSERALITSDLPVAPGQYCGNIQPNIGITGTPVINASTQTLYVVTQSIDPTTETFYFRLHALNLLTGAETQGGPVIISATIPGTGRGSMNGMQTFYSQWQNQRAALLLSRGYVYVTFASHCDFPSFQPPFYHGWMFGYNANSLTAPPLVWSDSANGNRAGMWQGGGGPAVDSSGNIYVEAGDGSFNSANGTYGDSIMKLAVRNNQITVLDYFRPSTAQSLGMDPGEVGSAGTVLLPDLNISMHPQEMVGAGKQGVMYVMDRNKLGHYNANGDQIVQEFQAAPPPGTQSGNGLWGDYAFWPANDTLYSVGWGDFAKSFPLDTTTGLFTVSAMKQGAHFFSFPGSSPSISWDGVNVNTGIVWMLDNSTFGGAPATLIAYQPDLTQTPLYQGSTLANAVKFTVPTVAKGKVYAGGAGQVTVFGLCNPGPCI